MKSKYPFKCILKYIPSRYDNLKDWQKANQRIVSDFKKGIVSEEHKTAILNAIKGIVNNSANEWVVCFVPAHTMEETVKRYTSLAAYLQANLECPVYIDSIKNYKNYNPVHQKGVKKEVKLHSFCKELFIGKHIVLFDDVITTGRSFREMGDKLIWIGALSVYGVCFAKTIHPNLPVKNKKETSKKTPMNSS